jgi:energy-coupling factor transport system permease protein
MRGFRYQEKNTFIHRLHPTTKAILLSIFLLAALSQERWYDPVILFLLLSLMTIASRIPMLSNILRSKVLITTGIFIIFIQILVRPNGNFLFYLIPSFIPVVGGTFPVTDFGLMTGINLYGRFVVIISSSFVFVQTTDPDKFASAFQHLKIPYRYSYAIILALRFVPLFNFEASQVKNAMAVRGVDFSQKLSITRTFKILRYTFLPLIVSTINRSEDLAISMQVRGFGAYSNRTFYKTINYKIWDFIALACGLGLLFAIYLW